MGAPNERLPYSETVAKYVRQAVQDGVTIKDILATINKKYQNAPRNTATFYKLYGEDIAEARAEITGRIGNVIVQQALEGHFPSQELYLRSKGGWSPTQTINEVDQTTDPDEDSSAIDALMTLLGKNPNGASTSEDNG